MSFVTTYEDPAKHSLVNLGALQYDWMIVKQVEQTEQVVPRICISLDSFMPKVMIVHLETETMLRFGHTNNRASLDALNFSPILL